jgi:hypothetical protein
MRIEGTPKTSTPSGELRGLDKFSKPAEDGNPNGKLRGLEKFTRSPEEIKETAGDIGGIAIEPATEDPRGVLRGTEKFPSTPAIEEKPSLVPEGYDMPKSALDRIEIKAKDSELKPFTDPEGLIVPGMVLSKPPNPERRLIVNLYEFAKTGTKIVVFHIEGRANLENTTPEEVKRKIAEGILVPRSTPED